MTESERDTGVETAAQKRARERADATKKEIRREQKLEVNLNLPR